MDIERARESAPSSNPLTLSRAARSPRNGDDAVRNTRTYLARPRGGVDHARRGRGGEGEVEGGEPEKGEGEGRRGREGGSAGPHTTVSA